MANTFHRRPVDGGDNNAWGPYVLADLQGLVGLYSSRLFDDSGTLKITPGAIGIDDGTNEGVSIIDTETTISLAGISNGNWAQIEMSVSGTNVTFAASDIAGKTDPAVLPTEFTGAFEPSKSGFYINANKRCVGVIYKDSGGVLGGVVNSNNNHFGYIGYVFLDTAQESKMFYNKNIDTYQRWVEYTPSTTWDMDNVVTYNIAHGLGGDWTKYNGCLATILQNGGAGLRYQFGNYDPGGGAGGSGVKEISSTNIVLARGNGSVFDAATFNAAVVKARLDLEE